MRPVVKFYLGIFVLLAIVALILPGIAHHGKIKVALVAVPADSSIYIDGQKSHAGNLYIKPGQHTFLATRALFSDYKTSLNIRSSQTIDLLPSPDSQAAKDYLVQHPSVQQQREQIGGQQFANSSQSLAQNNPIITQLPYTDVNGPFTINYGIAGINHVYLIVSNSSPNGRKAAIEWLVGQGYNPTTGDIHFADFTNPLTGKSDDQ